MRRGIRVSKDIFSSDIEQDIVNLEKLTDNNMHTKALIYLYKNILKDRKSVKALQAIEVLHSFFGSMPRELMDLRYREFYKPGMEAVKRKFGSDIAERIYGAF